MRRQLSATTDPPSTAPQTAPQFIQQSWDAFQRREARAEERAKWDRRLAIASLIVSAVTAAAMVYTISRDR